MKAPNRMAVKSVRTAVVVLGWKDNAKNETGFRLERKVGKKKFQVVQTLPANTTQVSVGPLDPGTYSFRVQAFNATTASYYSEVVKVRIPAGN